MNGPPPRLRFESNIVPVRQLQLETRLKRREEICRELAARLKESERVSESRRRAVFAATEGASA